MNRYQFTSDVPKTALTWPEVNRIYSAWQNGKHDYGIVRIFRVNEQCGYVDAEWMWATKGFDMGGSSGFSKGATMSIPWTRFIKYFPTPGRKFEVKEGQEWFSKGTKASRKIKILTPDTFFLRQWRVAENDPKYGAIVRKMDEVDIYHRFRLNE